MIRYAHVKVNGVDCMIRNGTPKVRFPDGAWTEVPNKAIRKMLDGLPSYDGVIVIGELPGSYEATVDGVFHEDGFPDFYLFVFDVQMRNPFTYRVRQQFVKEWCDASPNYVLALPIAGMYSDDGIARFREAQQANGYDDIVVRDENGFQQDAEGPSS